MKGIKNWVKSPIHIMLMLTAVAVLGMGSLAYFTDVEAAVNTIRFGHVDIETNEDVSGLTKTGIGVTATGTSDCYVRIRVDIPTVTYKYQEDGVEKTGQAMVTLPDREKLTASEWENEDSISDGQGKTWVKGGDGYWYYSGTLSMGNKVLFLKEITYPGLWNEAEGKLVDPLPDGLTADMLSIPITSEAVQADNIDVGGETGAQAAMEAFAKAAEAQ